MTIGIIGGGAFGTALAVALAREGRAVHLWARDPAAAQHIQTTRHNPRLPDITLPPQITIFPQLDPVFACDTLLLAIPAQALAPFLLAHGAALTGKSLIACCKGIDLHRMTGPASTIRALAPAAHAGILTGPSFAADIARGLPTALTLACADAAQGEVLQHLIATPALRLYRSADVAGAELGGALKNVIAIAAGVVMGAGLGDSARAALMTRGFAEMTRLATALGARGETLMGLSGFGDLVLTCTSAQSRNFRYGHALGAGQGFDPSVTVEGAATARAVAGLARRDGIDMPVTQMVAALVEGRIALDQAITTLLSRPLKPE